MKSILALLFSLSTAFVAEQADVIVVTANPTGVAAASCDALIS